MSKPQLKQTLRVCHVQPQVFNVKNPSAPPFQPLAKSHCVPTSKTHLKLPISEAELPKFLSKILKRGTIFFFGGGVKHVERGMTSCLTTKKQVVYLQSHPHQKGSGFEILHLCRRLLWQACETGRWADSLPCNVWCSQMTAQENLEWYTVDIHLNSCSNLEASFWIG